MEGPRVLHIVTVKGKGYSKAETDPITFHAPGYFNPETGEIKEECSHKKPVKYQTVFGKTLVELAQANERIVAITPAMLTGSSLTYMNQIFPERTFDVGIAEQHAVTFSAGLATKNYIPFCCIYSTFLQRAYDQIIHDVALQKLPVIFCIDRAGMVGEDGPTHHGQFDLAFLRIIPNLIISAPINEIALRNLMFTAQLQLAPLKPFAIRYPKGLGVIVDWQQQFQKVEIGEANLLNKGEYIAVLSIGHIGNNVITVTNSLKSQNIHIQHYDMVFLKPIDEEVLDYVATHFSIVITIEDGTISGGLGSAVSEYFALKNYTIEHISLGIPDVFIQHGTNEELYEIVGLSTEKIENLIKEKIFSHNFIYHNQLI
jgi:1-deoxy-D-xylulose-5-phosphate synthase